MSLVKLGFFELRTPSPSPPGRPDAAARSALPTQFAFDVVLRHGKGVEGGGDGGGDERRGPEFVQRRCKGRNIRPTNDGGEA